MAKNGTYAVPSPPSVSVAAAGIDPSIDGQSGISEIGSQNTMHCTHICKNGVGLYTARTDLLVHAVPAPATAKSIDRRRAGVCT